VPDQEIVARTHEIAIQQIYFVLYNVLLIAHDSEEGDDAKAVRDGCTEGLWDSGLRQATDSASGVKTGTGQSSANEQSNP